MKIRYLHIANDGIEKIHDTEKSFRNCVGMDRIRSGEMDQEKWDRFTLQKFEKDLHRGIVLSYSVIEEVTASGKGE